MNEGVLRRLSVSSTTSIRETMQTMDQVGQGIALVVDRESHLLGTVTDGDVRRAILGGVDLERPVGVLLERKAGTPHSTAVTGTVHTRPEELKALMLKHVLRHIPILDAADRVVDLVMLDDLLPAAELPVHALIMAGGFGTRMMPLTEETPKPMLPVGGKPLMERTLERLREAGIRRVTVSTHHRPEKIREHFGDGGAYGIEMEYVHEKQPLGTGGSLGLMDQSDEPLLVINGDVLTRVDFRAMIEYHKEHQAEMTIAVRHYGLKVPYGVVECEGPRVCSLREKPEVMVLVNAGVYVLEPSVQELVPRDQRFDMTDLIQLLLDANRTVVSFPIIEYWVDIGQPADYARAQNDAQAKERES